MKLLIICYGGLTDDRRAMYKEFALQGIELTVVVPAYILVDKTYALSGHLTYSDSYQEKEYKIIPVNIIAPGFIDSFNFFQLYKVIKSVNPDVIEVFNEYTSTHVTEAIMCRNWLSNKEKRFLIVVYAFENILQQKRPWMRGISRSAVKNNINKMFQPLLIGYHHKNVDALVNCNQEGIENIRQTGFGGALQKIFRGVDLKNFYQKEKNDCREKLQIPKDMHMLGCFCRLVPEKGLSLLIEAIAKLGSAYGLMIVGSGDYKNVLMDLAKKNGILERVYFFDAKPSSELIDYYNCLDVFVLPSVTTPRWKEQYGMVLIEAMACNLALVGSLSGAIPEVMSGYPKGLIFKEGDVADLIQKIKEVQNLNFPKSFDLQKFLYQFSMSHFVLEHITLFKELLSHD